MKQPNSTFCVCGVTRQINRKHFGLSHLSLFFKSYFLERRYRNLSFFNNMVFLKKMKNLDKYILLGDLSTLFLAALVFHV